MKKLSVLLLTGVLALAFAGCGGDDSAKTVPENQEKIVINQQEGDAAEAESAAPAAEVNPEALANSLLNDISYTDQLSQVDLETAAMFLNFADVDIAEAYIYESSGATAEEIVVLKCADAANASKAEEALKQRVSEQTENFTDYVPEEIPKLDSAVISVKDVYAVLSVSGDSAKAKELIGAALK